MQALPGERVLDDHRFIDREVWQQRWRAQDHPPIIDIRARGQIVVEEPDDADAGGVRSVELAGDGNALRVRSHDDAGGDEQSTPPERVRDPAHAETAGAGGHDRQRPHGDQPATRHRG
ncbi:MAG: hypothetical protein HYX51_11495 [Chloroflexi bacterium]|nr:hypothetical protein [Chloroflexota bacterium]